MTLLTESVRWKSFVTEKDMRKRQRLQEAVVGAASSADIKALVSLCREGQPAEQDAAMRVLMTLARQKPSMIDSKASGTWMKAAWELAVANYPNAPLGSVALWALAENDPARAEELLANHLEVQKLSEDALKRVMTDLRSFRTPAAIRRLQQIEQMGGHLAPEALNILEGWGFVSRVKLEALAEKWRKAHDRDALNRIYHVYINHLPESTVAMEELERLLGKPTQRRGKDLWYETEGACLFLESDQQGRLRGRKLN
jgi:hypothetical protein